MEIRILAQDDIKEVMPMKEAIEADKEALKMYSEGSANIPLRANLDVPEHEGQSLYMYGYAPKANALGVKIVSVYPKNIEKGLNSVPATMVNLDAETGQVSTLMDGTYLTRLRTGAIAGAATDVLARKDSKIFALFGTGGQAETQLEAVLNVREIELVKVFDISKERAPSSIACMVGASPGRATAQASPRATSGSRYRPIWRYWTPPACSGPSSTTSVRLRAWPISAPSRTPSTTSTSCAPACWPT